MPAFNKFNDFVNRLARGSHQLHASAHQLKVYLTNNAPDAAAHQIKSQLAEITPQNGYPAGGSDVLNDISMAGGVASIVGTDVVFTASGGSFGPFRYAVLYNDNDPGGSPTEKYLVGWWDYGSSISINDGESLTVDFGTSLFTIT